MTFYQTVHGKINVIEFLSQKPSSYTILCIHGSPSDARVFTYVGKTLSQAGYNVASMDLPGHGGSDGPRGDLDFAKCLQAINQIVSELKKKSKVIMMSHSMGSTVALWYARSYKNRLDGLIVLCPYIRIKNIKRSDVEPSASTFLYLLFGRIFTPRKTVSITKLLPTYAKISGEEFAEMAQDPTVNLEYSFRYFVDVMAGRNSKVTELADIVDPVLLLHGKRDRNVFPQVSEEYIKLLRAPRKDLKIFDCNHWFFDAVAFRQDSQRYPEESRKEFISTIIEWIDSIGTQAVTDAKLTGK